MPEPTGTSNDAREPGTWRRRGLLAAAWAAVAGVVLKQTTQPVEAVAASVQYSSGDTITFYYNLAATPVEIDNQRPFSGGNVLRVNAFGNTGVDAIVGDAASLGGRNGVTGMASTTDGVGASRPIVVADLDRNGINDIIIDFGPGAGIWVFLNNTSWYQLTALSANQIVVAHLKSPRG